MTGARADDRAALITSLDLPTKVALLTGASGFTLVPEPSIGLGELRLSDGPTGVRGLKFSDGRVVALLPNATLLAACWSEQTAYEAGQLLAQEALAQGIHVVLGPTINLHRSPLGGRLFEAYSEDPLLTGRLAAAYVRGLQDSGVGACLKHLVANESETERTTVNSVLDEATLREVYLLPFEIATADADPWSMMAAYNDVNGVPATEQRHVITEIVKGEWGYRGLVMSDWSATGSAAPAATAGLDLVMPGPDGPWGDALVAAVRAGEVSEAVIDEHVERLLRLAARVGALGAPPEPARSFPAPDSAQRRAQLTRLAAQGMTVLKNDAAALPLHRDASVALIGRHAVETIGMGGGSAVVNPPYQVSVACGLTEQMGDRVTVTDGVAVRTRPVPARDGFLTDPRTGEAGVRVTLYDAAGAELEHRHAPAAITAVGMDDDFPGTAASVRLDAVITGGGPVELGAIGVGAWTVRAGERTLTYRLAVSGTGMAEEILAPPSRTDVVDVAAGTALSATVTLPGGGRPGDGYLGAGRFGLVANPASRETVDVIDDAVRAAGDADVAVVVVGLTEEQETESVDKTTLHLPGAQDALVEAVAGAARRTVVVVNAATPVVMPWLPRVDAVLLVGLPGQEAGRAVAAALLGDVEPAGRLVGTFPVDDGMCPAWSVTPVDGELRYAEGRHLGYRGHFAGRASEPAFWLGHGLGYGDWAYSDARVVAGDGTPGVTVTVTNTGIRASREVVQVYYQPPGDDEPVRLAGWRDVTLPPGESARLVVPTDPRVWRRWDTGAGAWQRLTGGELLIARGLGDVRATLPVPA
ncbi:beta-glucosidase family protein [Mangrovihabitans endophyticus]|uniref:Glycosyl hydrolase n=1 Tax=Mangrovihabitans endophyticus TaxID=1751298 RepID=A0A8J3C4I7_9ACTN|nr:glycoside hydrolase family 3 C-terminal domain-containing protein [Mangrovihabitans endophyticus]GGL16690.1 glycosyl hydrolase [Mangrovihabitans endophyticus]